MQQITSDALELVSRAMGISGTPGSQDTQLADGEVIQTLDVTALVRRGRTAANSGGLFTGAMQNVHTDAETLTTTIVPYDVTTGRIAPYPGPVPSDFDVWLLHAGLSRNSGGGTLTASLILDFPAVQQGFGLNDSGVAVVRTARVVLSFWDAILTGPGLEFAINEQGNPWLRQAMRLPRACSMRFVSVSSLTSTYSLDLLLGLFPIGLGQDVIT